MDRRDFVRTTAAGVAAAATPAALSAAETAASNGAPAVHLRRSRPLCVADVSSIRYKNGGPESAIERAFRGITEGEDVLDAIVAGVNIPELDPDERGIGYGGLPNADGVVQLDSCLMHGPNRWAGGVAGIEGVRTPSLVAKAVAELTDHHLIVGAGAQEFARALGFEVEDDLNTPASRELWLEWKRRIDPGHWLNPQERLSGQSRAGEDTDPDEEHHHAQGKPADGDDNPSTASGSVEPRHLASEPGLAARKGARRSGGIEEQVARGHGDEHEREHQ